MRSNSGGFPPGLAALIEQAGQPAQSRPVERWNPPYCGEIDIRVAADGTWFYRGSAIRREPLVRLFASVLRREEDGTHVLVTPVEKLGITVDDAPFLAVEMATEGEGPARDVSFRTNVGDVVTAGRQHPIRFESETGTGGLKPYVDVRRGLEALATRSLSLELVALGDERDGMLGVWSGGAFFEFTGRDRG
jgi:hypothetical protein